MESDPWVLWLGVIAVKGSVITTIAAVIVFVLGRQAALRHLVATLALVSTLVLPFVVFVVPTWSVPIPQAMTDDPPPHMPNLAISHSVAIQPLENDTSRLPGQSQIVPRSSFDGQTPPPPKAVPSLPKKPLPWAAIFITLWAIGTMIALAFRLWGWLALARLHKRSEPEPTNQLLARLFAARKRLGIRRNVKLRRSDDLSVPVTFGALRPVVLVPASAPGWPAKRQELVLLHELAHVRRFDWLTQTLGQTACALYWFNPFAWWLLRQMDTSREFACDDMTLHTGAIPSEYAQELLHFAHASRVSSLETFTVPMARQSNIERRVRRILRNDRTRIALTIATILLAVAGCAVVLLPLAGMRPAPKKSATSDVKSILTLGKNATEKGAENENEETDSNMDDEEKHTATRAGISEAVRAGSLTAVKRILTEKPELLHSENPYNWANLDEMRVWP